MSDVRTRRSEISKGLSPWLLMLCCSGAVLFALCGSAEAQQPTKIPRVGILPPGPMSERKHLWAAFNQGLRDLGYVEGQNIALILPSTDVKPERLPQHADEMVNRNVDIIVAAGTAAVRAAKEATKTIPIVTPVVTDPVEAGLVASLARPGGNVTGVTLISVQLSGKRLELLREVVLRLTRVAALSNPTSLGSPLQIKETMAAARTLGIQLQAVDVRDSNNFEQAFEEATKERAGALLTLDDPLFFTHRSKIVELAAKRRLPAIYGFREFVEVGGLISYAANLSDMYRRAATYVDKILKGAKPADLPVEQPTKFELVINLKTAKQIGLAVPPIVLARADRVIR
jgi:putative tryptophan/tyrosine transport system substrate-binding protein